MLTFAGVAFYYVTCAKYSTLARPSRALSSENLPLCVSRYRCSLIVLCCACAGFSLVCNINGFAAALALVPLSHFIHASRNLLDLLGKLLGPFLASGKNVLSVA